MPAARNQAVQVRRPLAKRIPSSSRGRRAALRRSSQWARRRKVVATKAGSRDNSMAGSLTRDSLSKSHRVQGAGLCPLLGKQSGGRLYRKEHPGRLIEWLKNRQGVTQSTGLIIAARGRKVGFAAVGDAAHQARVAGKDA